MWRSTDCHHTVSVILAVVVTSWCTPMSANCQVPIERQVEAHLLLGSASAHLNPHSLVAVNANGSFLVAVGPSGPATLYSPSGKIVGQLRSPTATAEEGIRLAQIGWVLDSPWVRSGTTVNVYGPDARWARSSSLILTVQGPPGFPPIDHGEQIIGRALLAALLPEGDLLLWEWARRVMHEVPVQAGGALALVRVSARGAFREIRDLQFGADAGCRIQLYQDFGGMVIPFCAMPKGELSPNGETMATVHGARPMGDSVRFVLTVVQRGSDTLSARSFTVASVPVAQRERDSAFADLKRKFSGSRVPGFVDSAMSALRHNAATFHAPVVRVLVANGGETWLELFTREHLHRWLVVGSRGESLGVLSLPASVSLVAAIDGAAWGLDATGPNSANLMRFRLVP